MTKCRRGSFQFNERRAWRAWRAFTISEKRSEEQHWATSAGNRHPRKITELDSILHLNTKYNLVMMPLQHYCKFWSVFICNRTLIKNKNWLNYSSLIICIPFIIVIRWEDCGVAGWIPWKFGLSLIWSSRVLIYWCANLLIVVSSFLFTQKTIFEFKSYFISTRLYSLWLSCLLYGESSWW